MLISEARLRKIIRETLKESRMVGLPAAKRMVKVDKDNIMNYSNSIAMTYVHAVGPGPIITAANRSGLSEEAVRNGIMADILAAINDALVSADEKLQELGKKDGEERGPDQQPGWLKRGELPPVRK